MVTRLDLVGERLDTETVSLGGFGDARFERAGIRPGATEAGLEAAAQVTRNHRLWELYLIEYAEVATSRVDRDADAVEHILGEKMVTELETKLLKLRMVGGHEVPASPHPIQPGD